VRRDRPQLIDAGVLLAVGAIVAMGVAVRAEVRPLALVLGLAATAVLVLRRRAPTATFLVSSALVFALFTLDHSAGAVAVVAPAVALYSLALTRGRVHIVVAVIGASVAVVVADLIFAGPNTHALTTQTAAHVALVAVPVLAAEALRNRRAYVRVLLERLELAERTREEEARGRAEQERLRIARELHDIVAHTLTTINVQAGVAAHLLDRDLGNARDALATIETASHDALEEMRSILGVLREPRNGNAPLEPPPDLAAVRTLIERTRNSGLDIRFEVEGDPQHVPDAVQLATFRIVQESLTNARRHAPGAATRVNLAYRPNRLRLAIENELSNTGSGRKGAAGVGIAGMRERARALGGTFEAQQSERQFRVVAELPYRNA
jgi:signal transduction histidine kinase